MPSHLTSIRRLPLVLAACAVPLVGIGVLVGACGSKDGDGQGAAPTPVGVGGPTVNTAISPKVSGPAKKYTILVEELPQNTYRTSIGDTYDLTVENYSITPAFNSAEEGQKLLKQWGYLGGYETTLRAEGNDQALLLGAFDILMESHLFETEAGAKAAYEYFVQRQGVSQGWEQIPMVTVGNASTELKALSGTIGKSSVKLVAHRVIFRRGNVVAAVVTLGAETLMKPDAVRDLALQIDDKALGETDAPEPTPVSNFTPPTYASNRTPTPKPGTPTPVATPTPTGVKR